MIGVPRVHARRLDSTNARAREIATAGAPHGTLVTAGEQSAGRGRQGRRWVAAAGDALLMSLVVRDPSPLLPLAAAAAVCEACDALGARERALVKWPNDVWLGEERKAAGILIEGRPQEGWAVLGIGLNVRTREFPEELGGRATSLALAGADVGLGEALAAVLAALARALDARDADLTAAWAARDALRGREVAWDGGAGEARGIEPGGGLIVDLRDGGRATLDAGEVHLAPRARK